MFYDDLLIDYDFDLCTKEQLIAFVKRATYDFGFTNHHHDFSNLPNETASVLQTAYIPKEKRVDVALELANYVQTFSINNRDYNTKLNGFIKRLNKAIP